MRVLTIVTRLNIGGASPPVIALAAGLRARGHESVLVAGTPEPAEGSMNEDAMRAGAVLELVPALRRNPHPIRDARAFAELLAIIRRQRPDIVMTHMSKAGAVGRVAALLARVPVVVHTYHGKGFGVFDGGWKTSLVVMLERALARTASASIVVSEKQREEFIGLRVDRPEKLKTIRYGLDLDSYANPAGTSSRLRERLDLPADALLVGVVGRLVAIKGQDVFIRAAAALASRFPRVHFVLVGDGDRRVQYEQLVQDLGVSRRVSFLGWRRDVPQVLADLDVVVLPTVNDFEGTPLAVIEALAARRPVVATDVGGVGEVIRHRETGMLVPPRDTSALAEAIAELLEHRADARRMAAEGQRKVMSLYQQTRMIDETEAWLFELLQRAIPGRTIAPAGAESSGR